TLQRIGRADAESIILARTAPVVMRYGHLDAIKQRMLDEPLFPLGRRWLDQFFQTHIDARPREVLNAARECWRHRQESVQRRGIEAWLADPYDDPPAVAVGPEATPRFSADDIRAAIDRKVAEKIEEHKRIRDAAPDGLPPDKGQLAGIVAKLV